MNENYVTLGQVCDKGSSNIAQKDLAEREGQYPIYGAAGLIKNVDFAHQKQPYIAVVKDGAGIGRVMKLPAYSSVIGTMQYIFPKENVDIDYLFYALQHMNLGKYFSGSTIPHIYFRDYQKERLKLPVMEVQQRQADTLSRIDALSAYGQRQIALMDEIVKSRFVELFGALDANPYNWEISKLNNFCDLQNGYAFKSGDYVESSGVLNCRMSNIRPDGGFDSEYHPKFLPNEFWDQYREYRLNDGDVIIAMTDMASDPKILGVPTIVRTNGKRFLLNQRVGKLTFYNAERINNVYLMFVLSQKNIRQQLVKKAGGSTQINVGKPAILGIEFLVPPIELQEQFAAFVAEVDKSKLAVQQSIDQLETLKKSLMQKYFG